MRNQGTWLLGILAIAVATGDVRSAEPEQIVSGTSGKQRWIAGYSDERDALCMAGMASGLWYALDRDTGELWLVDTERTIRTRLDGQVVQRWTIVMAQRYAWEQETLAKALADPHLEAVARRARLIDKPDPHAWSVEQEIPPDARQLPAFVELFGHLKALRDTVPDAGFASPHRSLNCVVDLRKVPFRASFGAGNGGGAYFSVSPAGQAFPDWRRYRKVDLLEATGYSSSLPMHEAGRHEPNR